ncbi:sodium:proton antiporter [Aminithiophilus ramosus]|uniref:Sodium:proton antiporter n=2 Tax=Synergistales TaxID=649776 RepID=A0A9Q7EZ29_9BACT|nr:hydrogen gas-evolving membrane-bound hydrogenase subunit E [Aminithiophilus ramosus]QTX31782.1 sodium:proton antiporter [Aminithiophilus ramosus]QVL35604.1 sodium:proton antiporter [Synergistota bacterium]
MRGRDFQKLGALALALTLGGWLWRGVTLSPYQGITGPAARYILRTAEETGASNVVAAILFDYRGFDTLGEASVIYTTVCGVALLFAKRRYRRSSHGLSFIVKRGMALLVPFILLYASSIIVMGHLSPGGGFQGGAVMATVTVLFCVVYGSSFEAARVNPKVKETIESLGALLFLVVGLVGLWAGGEFLSNGAAGFHLGTRGHLFSGGTIPLLNVAVGMKVGAGLSTLFYSMVKILEDPTESSPEVPS